MGFFDLFKRKKVEETKVDTPAVEQATTIENSAEPTEPTVEPTHEEPIAEPTHEESANVESANVAVETPAVESVEDDEPSIEEER